MHRGFPEGLRYRAIGQISDLRGCLLDLTMVNAEEGSNALLLAFFN
jgi:hypothetical protein